MKIRLRYFIVPCLALGINQAVYANMATASMMVSVKVKNNCLISTAPIAPVALDDNAQPENNLPLSASLTLACSGNLNPVINFNAGNFLGRLKIMDAPGVNRKGQTLIIYADVPKNSLTQTKTLLNQITAIVSF